jgi:hypothetical protein
MRPHGAPLATPRLRTCGADALATYVPITGTLYGKIGRGPVRYPTGPRPYRGSKHCLSHGVICLSQQLNRAKVAVTIPRPVTPTSDLRWRPRRPVRALAALLALAACLLASGCATVQPAPLGVRELAEAQTFPFYRVYWVGPRFGAYPLAAADGIGDYNSAIGDSVYYGNCVSGKSSALSASGCVLPLQVTTMIYSRHPNAPLSPQRNTVLRGVPAVIYNGGRSIELYSGRLAIDVSAESLSAGLRAVRALYPINAPSSAAGRFGDASGNGDARQRRASPGFGEASVSLIGPLPPPVFCPGLSPTRPPALKSLLLKLPGRPCQQVAQTLAIDRALFGKG